MSCDLGKLRRAASRRLITDNSMASGPPYYNEILKYMSEMPPNALGTPLLGTESTLLPTWQQTYTPSIPYNAAIAHTPSRFSTLVSSTSIFQYNSPPPLPKSRTKKRPNNENPDTPAPKRARKTGTLIALTDSPYSASSLPVQFKFIKQFNFIKVLSLHF